MTQLAIAYIRVSTLEQANEGISLDAQRARIDAWCLANDYTLGAVYEDRGISAASMTRREGLANALAASKKGMSLVVFSLTRLSRSVKDLITIVEQLQKQGADLVSLSEKLDTASAFGEAAFLMLGIMGQLERRQIAERTATALQHKKRIGRVYGKTPFGFDAIDGHLVEAPDEARVVRDLLHMREGGATLRECANRLNEAKIPTKQRGARWYASSVREVLQRQAPVVAASV